MGRLGKTLAGRGTYFKVMTSALFSMLWISSAWLPPSLHTQTVLWFNCLKIKWTADFNDLMITSGRRV
ncbi:Protein of unknown function [Gryllus bimaculatus]|nr:Protein of unknown function [Gryllus bimaculatus]